MSYVTLRIIIILMETIKDLYQTPTRRPAPGGPWGYRTAPAGGQLPALNRLRAEALATLPLGIDAGEIDGPVWSVSGRGTAGALDRVAQIPARPFRLGLTRVL